jgi:hypothetical protein
VVRLPALFLVACLSVTHHFGYAISLSLDLVYIVGLVMFWIPVIETLRRGIRYDRPDTSTSAVA